VAAVEVIRRWANTILATLALLGAALLYRKGRADERTKADIQEWNEYVATRKRIDAIDHPDSDDDVDRWLRERAKRGGGL
jgi:hypothetical protein